MELERHAIFHSVIPKVEQFRALEHQKAFDIVLSGSSRIVPVTFGQLYALPVKNIAFNSFEATCWGPPKVVWSGAGLSDLIHNSIEGTSAKYVQFSSSDYGYCIKTNVALRVNPIIAYSRDFKPIGPGQGGPCALVANAPQAQLCITGLKAIKLSEKLPANVMPQKISPISRTIEKIKRELLIWKLKTALGKYFSQELKKNPTGRQARAQSGKKLVGIKISSSRYSKVK